VGHLNTLKSTKQLPTLVRSTVYCIHIHAHTKLGALFKFKKGVTRTVSMKHKTYFTLPK